MPKGVQVRLLPLAPFFMQTFLPYPDFRRSAWALDNRRLGKQRVECLQLLQALTGFKTVETVTGWRLDSFNPKGWVNHPATKMWRGYEGSLAEYAIACCDEWVRRGYRDTCRQRIITLVPTADPAVKARDAVKPPWFGDEAFHASHRSNLLRKDPKWYGHAQFGWAEPNDLPYIWPVE
ncbi:MAG TPA: MSMEG_6728 family protein [Nitrospira sp.]|nr:MSMEG_6728 family protein [Nitrospira sp.]